MNSKAFTLFTALVSFVLITLAFVLVQSMIEAERASSQTIQTIDEQTEMQNIADLARADALQVFNVGVRYRLELWLIDHDNEFYILDKQTIDAPDSWQKIIDDFTAAEFGSVPVSIGGETKPASEQLAYRMTDNLITTLSKGGNVQLYNFKGYNVLLQINDDPLHPTDSTIFKNITQQIIINGVNNHKLLEPIECPSTSGGCDVGTFFINLDLTQLSFEEYSRLPQIVVKSYASGRVIKQPILPKGNIRVYVPLRVFKALWKARDIADDVFNFGNGIKDYGLGMCDSECKVRVSPKSGSNASVAISGKLCPNTDPDFFGNSLKNVTCAECPGGRYNPEKPEEMGNKLREFILEQAQADTSLNTSALDPQGSTDGLKLWNGLQAPAEDIVRSSATRTIETKTIIACNPDKATCLLTSNGKAYCVKAAELKVVLEFFETKEEYMVNKARSKDPYKIIIADTYSPTIPNETCYSITTPVINPLNPTPGGSTSDTYSCEP